jgi:glucosamine--fructose-6-phosphate aminotransferase (isomerizing)
MYDMITQQPDAIARVIKDELPLVQALASRLQNIQQIYIVGIGTSWHATLVGEHFFRFVANRPDVRAIHSFEFCEYPPPLSANAAVIILSHRGTKQYSLKALEYARAHGSLTAICTSIGSGARVDLCDYVFRTSEPEKSSAFTVSHTCAMTLLLLMATELGVLKASAPALALRPLLPTLPKLVDDVIKQQEPEVQKWVQAVKDYSTFYFAGYGPNVSNTYEVALKIKEAAYLTTEGFQLEQYLHGPYCATDKRTVLTVLNHAKNARVDDAIGAVHDVGGYVCEIQNGDCSRNIDRYTTLTLPKVEEAFVPILYLLPLQLFTYWLALAQQKNPDVFRRNDPLYAAAIAKVKL